MNKAEILEAIRSIAATNGDKAPGSQRLSSETGMRKSDWYPKLWVRWSDAVREAGLRPNSLSAALPDDDLLLEHIKLIRELGRFPIESDLRLKQGRTLLRLGNKRQRLNRVLEYSRSHDGFEDVIPFCEAALAAAPSPSEVPVAESSSSVGYVYMVKHGSRAEYKIGRTTNPLRREGELRIELPESLHPVHTIKTDDPAGVESYWHRRFAEKRKQGEWFALTAAEVQTFKRWKRIF